MDSWKRHVNFVVTLRDIVLSEIGWWRTAERGYAPELISRAKAIRAILVATYPIVKMER